MRSVLVGLLLILILSCSSKKDQTLSDEIDNKLAITSFYVGTYTNVKSVEQGGSEGIYHYTIDESGKLAKIGLAVKSENPSFLAKTTDNKYVVAVNEIDTNEGNGTVESYQVEGDKLKKISGSSSGGAHPCHIAINDIGQVTVANYTGGNVGLLNISKNGTLSDLLDVHQHEGKGSHKRQEAPHAHSSRFRPDGRGVVSADLGSNELWFSEIENNKFIPQEESKLAMRPGAGPRHIDFHPNGKFLYVLNELENTIGLVHLQKGGSYILGDTYSMLPDGFTDFSKGADIHISTDGRFLYASNRGHNSIAIFKVNILDGSLFLKGTESTRGDSPRNFQLALDDKYLVVANQKSDNIVCFKRDNETGKLTYVSEVDASAPVCLLF
jgi:6-phosphogluconolactonase